jgi:hypothetical protein
LGKKQAKGGISDVTLETKWLFFESDGLSFAVKPGLSFPSGDNENDMDEGPNIRHVPMASEWKALNSRTAAKNVINNATKGFPAMKGSGCSRGIFVFGRDAIGGYEVKCRSFESFALNSC